MCEYENYKYIYEGTRELIKEMNNIYSGDSFYICCHCGNYEEYIRTNFIYCNHCNKHFCLKCFPDLVNIVIKNLKIVE